MGGGGSDVEYIDPYAGTGVRELLKKVSDMVSPQVGQGITPYSGQITAGASPLQEQGFAAASNLGTVGTDALNFFQNLLNQQQNGGGQYQQMAGDTLTNLMQPWDPTAEQEMWQQTFVNPAMQTWKNEVLPQIVERYGSGGVGGAMSRELSQSGADLMTNLSGQLANVLYNSQQAALDRQQTGVNQAMAMEQLPGQLLSQAGQVGGMGTDMLSQLLNIGGVQRGITQGELSDAYTKWQMGQPYNNPYLQNFLGTLVNQQPMQAYIEEDSPGLFQQLLPGLGAFVGAGGLSGVGGLTGSGANAFGSLFGFG